MRLHDLKPAPGSKHRKKRLGKGESSGLGKTSGKGHKGQKSRSGASIRPGFEGGQMPLYRRLPRRGFNNAQFKTKYAIVNLADLEIKFKAGDTVNEESLRACGLVKGTFDGIKLLGNGDLTKKLEVSVDKISASAKEKLEKAGCSVTEPAAPAKREEAPAKKEKASAKKEEASAKKEEAPAKKEKASAKKEEAPAKKEKASARKEEAPDKAEEDSDKTEEKTGKE